MFEVLILIIGIATGFILGVIGSRKAAEEKQLYAWQKGYEHAMQHMIELQEFMENVDNEI